MNRNIYLLNVNVNCNIYFYIPTLGTGVLTVVNNHGIKKLRMLFAHAIISMVHGLWELWILHSF